MAAGAADVGRGKRKGKQWLWTVAVVVVAIGIAIVYLNRPGSEPSASVDRCEQVGTQFSASGVVHHARPNALTEVAVYGREPNGRTRLAVAVVRPGRNGTAPWNASMPVTTPAAEKLKCHANVSFLTER